MTRLCIAILVVFQLLALHTSNIYAARSSLRTKVMKETRFSRALLLFIRHMYTHVRVLLGFFTSPSSTFRHRVVSFRCHNFCSPLLQVLLTLFLYFSTCSDDADTLAVFFCIMTLIVESVCNCRNIYASLL